MSIETIMIMINEAQIRISKKNFMPDHLLSLNENIYKSITSGIRHSVISFKFDYKQGDIVKFHHINSKGNYSGNFFLSLIIDIENIPGNDTLKILHLRILDFNIHSLIKQ
jgi:hypothetical protein